jgi:hypothetical protein
MYFSPYTAQHNCQQRELSKSLMATSSSLPLLTAGPAGQVSKMASKQEKAFCVLRYEVSRSVIQYSVSFVHCLQKSFLCGAYFLNRARNSR